MFLLKKIKDNLMFSILICFLSVYYLYRLFHIVPWYDELYTYISFIDKGFFYSATHWPAPNNHIFFSMLSSLIDCFGIYIGLRGISFLSAVGTVFLLYIFFKEFMSKNLSVILICFYSLLLLTNKLAIQGRGYSLATFFLMLAIYCGYRICYKDCRKKEYVFWAISLWLGLYTVVTSIYWVVAVCLCCGIVLLIMKKYRKLFKLIGYSLMAAFATIISYGIMWFSIGAQQISNDITSGYYGSDKWFLIKEFPRTCLLRGINIMTSDRSVQGIDRSAFLRDFKYFGRGVLSSFFSGNTDERHLYALMIIVLICFILLFICTIKKNTRCLYLLALSSISFVGVFITLLIQSAYPFTRVFSFMGVFLIMPICISFLIINSVVAKYKKYKSISFVFVVIVFLFSFFKLYSPIYMAEYDYTDYYAYDAVKEINWDDVGTYLVSDVYVEQQVDFHRVIGHGKDLSFDTDSPDVILTKKATLTSGWPNIINDEILNDCFISERPVIYENDLYIVYGR